MPVRIKDGIIPYTGGQGIEITDNHVINVLLREMNNLIQVNGDRELYVDLQLPSGIKPTDTFPVGVTTGKILQADGWQQSGLILNWKTTSGDYNRLIYANDGKLYIDKGNGVWVELGGGGCDCHNIEHWQFYDDDTSCMMPQTPGTTPSVGTIVVGDLSTGYTERYNKISFDGEEEIDIIYTNGTNNYGDTFLWDEINVNGYSGAYFSGIIANDNNTKKFVVWNVGFQVGA